MAYLCFFPSPNYIIELESIINDIMITMSNGLSTNITTNQHNRLISPTCNIHLHYDQFADEPAKILLPKCIKKYRRIETRSIEEKQLEKLCNQII